MKKNGVINNYSFHKHAIKTVFALFLCLIFLSLVSSVSAEMNWANDEETGNDIQYLIDHPECGDEVILNPGTYTNNIKNLNVTRDITFTCKSLGQTTIRSTIGGVLFNITSGNVKIIGLNIEGYTTAIKSSNGNINITGNKITTTGVSIELSGSDSTSILIKNNVITSKGSSSSGYGVFIKPGSSPVIDISFVNNTIVGSTGVFITQFDSDNRLNFTNNNIKGISNYGIYISSNATNNFVFNNNNISGNSSSAVFLQALKSNNTITFNNNNMSCISNVNASSAVVYLDALDSNNIIVFTNNNVSGQICGVYLDMHNNDTNNTNNTITFDNNNISTTLKYDKSILGIVHILVENCNNNMVFTNNYISGFGYYSLAIIANCANNTITINNNVISNKLTGSLEDMRIVHIEGDGGNNYITMDKNKISGTLNLCVGISGEGGNNTIVFTNNKIDGSISGTNFHFAYSKNTITYFNNIINVVKDGIYLYLYGSDNTITITNNNATAYTGEGFYFVTSCSNNNVNIVNNRIMGNIGFVTFSHDSYNFINIINNKFIGLGDNGISMNIYGANNTISIRDNDIFGSPCGFLLSIMNNNNILFSVVGNNITATEYAMICDVLIESNSLYLFNNTFSSDNIGLCFNINSYFNKISNTIVPAILNNVIISGNTINAKNIGLYFKLSDFVFNEFYNGIFNGNYKVFNTDITAVPAILNNVIISGNTINANNIGLCFKTGNIILNLTNNANNESNVTLFTFIPATLNNIIFSGNTIIAINEGISFEGFEDENSSINVTVNYNRILGKIGLNFLVGATKTGSNFDYNWWGVNDITDKILGFKTNNHYILKITNLTNMDDIYVGDMLRFVFLLLNTTLKAEGIENLPFFVINGTFNGEYFSTSRDDGFIYQFTIVKEGLQTLDAYLDDESDILTLNAKVLRNSGEDDDLEEEESFIDSDDSKKDDLDNGTTPHDDSKDNSKESSNNAFASMKSTGLPVYLLILAILGLIVFRRKL